LPDVVLTGGRGDKSRFLCPFKRLVSLHLGFLPFRFYGGGGGGGRGGGGGKGRGEVLSEPEFFLEQTVALVGTVHVVVDLREGEREGGREEKKEVVRKYFGGIAIPPSLPPFLPPSLPYLARRQI